MPYLKVATILYHLKNHARLFDIFDILPALKNGDSYGVQATIA